MGHWPRTVSGKLFYVTLAAVVVPLMVWFVATLPGFVLLALGGVALVSVAIYALRRKMDAARERAWVGEFSFGDVVDRMRAREALDF
jgi:predicted membrane channel-forming protein YqfA (hemolysin III family)